jgi:hypothetical protein
LQVVVRVVQKLVVRVVRVDLKQFVEFQLQVQFQL